jgi:hypothetical protein
MDLRQGSGQVGQDNSKEQQRKKMRPLRLQLPLYVPGLPLSVLLVAVLGSQERAPEARKYPTGFE